MPLVDPSSILGYVLVEVFTLNIPLLFSTVNICEGLSAPIPTLPSANIVIFGVLLSLFVPKFNTPTEVKYLLVSKKKLPAFE